MERLKDHKETKVDETQVEAGQVWPGAWLRTRGQFPFLAAAQQSTRMEKQQLDPIRSATCWCAEGMWSPGQDQRSSGKEHSAHWQGGWLRYCLLEHKPMRGKGKGEGKLGKDGQPWWEEAISISVVTYLCSDLVMWSK